MCCITFMSIFPFSSIKCCYSSMYLLYTFHVLHETFFFSWYISGQPVDKHSSNKIIRTLLNTHQDSTPFKLATTIIFNYSLENTSPENLLHWVTLKSTHTSVLTTTEKITPSTIERYFFHTQNIHISSAVLVIPDIFIDLTSLHMFTCRFWKQTLSSIYTWVIIL